MSCCVSSEEFKSAVKKLGYTAPTDDQYSHFAKELKKSKMGKDEAAMFLAQIIHESGGLKHKEEQMDAKEREKHYEGYHGRGYIQLTHKYNYEAASEDLGLKLVDYPDLVLEEDNAWKVSFWFWKKNVQPRLKTEFRFDVTTDAINGTLEPIGHPLRVERTCKYAVVCKELKCLPKYACE